MLLAGSTIGGALQRDSEQWTHQPWFLICSFLSPYPFNHMYFQRDISMSVVEVKVNEDIDRSPHENDSHMNELFDHRTDF
jgi:hypothetical protein